MGQADVAEVVTNEIKLIKVKLGHTVLGCGIFDFVKRDDELAGRTVLVASFGDSLNHIGCSMYIEAVNGQNVTESQATTPSGNASSFGARSTVCNAGTVSDCIIVENKTICRV